MIRVPLRPLSAAFALVLCASACSHANDDASATASPPAAATTAPESAVAPSAAVAPATPEASAAASIDGKRESVSKNGVSASMGAATEKDLAEIGLPIYPTVTLENTFLVKHVDKASAAYRFQVSVKDDIATVSDWYAKKLGRSFAESHVAVLGGLTSFSRKSAGSNESILLQAQQDENLKIPLTTITMTVTKRR